MIFIFGGKMKPYKRHRKIISIIMIFGALVLLIGCGGGGGNESFSFGPPPVPCGSWPFPPCSQQSLSPVTHSESPPLSTETLDNWHLSAFFPSISFNALTYGNGIFVGVGQGGTIVTSTDGANWSAQNSGTEKDLFGVGYGNGIFVVVGNDATILTSSDGAHWTDRSLSKTYGFYGVAYGNGVFVIVGRLASSWGLSFNSPDGRNWAGPYLTNDASTLDSVVYGDNIFVAVGSGNTQIQTSPDGATWTERYKEYNKVFKGVTYGAGRFIAVGWEGKILYSPDGITWTNSSLPDNHYMLEGVAYGDGTFVTVGRWSEIEGKIFSSPDGVNWRARYSGISNELRGITYSNSTFVIVVNNGTIFQSEPVQ